MWSLDIKIWILALLRLFNYLGGALSYIFLAPYLIANNFGNATQIGASFSFGRILGALIQRHTGKLSDYFGRHIQILLSMFFKTAGYIFLGFIVLNKLSLIWIFFVFLFLSISDSLFLPASDAMVADLTTQENRVKAYSLQKIGANIGWATGPFLGSFFAKDYLPQLMFFSAPIYLISGIIGFISLKSYGIKSIKSNYKENFKKFKSSNYNIPKKLYPFVAGTFIIALLAAAFFTPVPMFLKKYKNIDSALFGRLFSINGLIVIIFQGLVYKIANKFGNFIIILLGNFFYISAYIYLALLGIFDFNTLIIMIVLMSIGEILIEPTIVSVYTENAHELHKGELLGVYRLFYTLGRASAAFIVGISIDLFATKFNTGLWFIWAGIGVLNLLLFTYSYFKLKKY